MRGADAQPLPDPAGTATLDQPARTLTLGAMPAHASLLVAWREAAGGEPEPCGISDGLTVSVSETSPLVPGTVYKVWVTGRNSRGDGPPSNEITFTA